MTKVLRVDNKYPAKTLVQGKFFPEKNASKSGENLRMIFIN